MKRLAFSLPALVLLFLFLSACPASAYSGYPLGGVWEYSGTVTVTIDGKQAVLRDSGRITIDSGYSYDWWSDDFDEKIRTFGAKGTFSLSLSPEIREDYNHFRQVYQWYNFRSFEISVDDALYFMEVTGRTRADLKITRTIGGRRVSAVFSAVRIRWDEDWDDDYGDGLFFGVGGGCSTGTRLSVFFLLPLLFLSRKK
ncbi:hypothetical protein [Aminivibrio sp.]|jgi:hypothetical protein|uniref:hypothetical protein n=1 Tax=Aminivibrio sp. TaxID=1872489 RepID=UPI001A4A05F2|nr:hypothetical protein [Aminivibrio sp.]MBL3538471.1 hypothetical protein [Aminivibrio sp.]